MRNLFDLSRRAFVGLSALAASGPLISRSRGAEERAANRLWYRQPASRWEEALPIGNGRLGCMVFGRTTQERLQLNEDTLWSGGPYIADNPKAFATLPEVRRLIAEGKYKEAEALASEGVMARPLSQMSYGTLGDLLLDFIHPPAAPSRYEQSLDLAEAVVETRYSGPLGNVRRQAFVSAPDDVIVVRLEGPRTSIDFDLQYSAPHETRHAMPNNPAPATGAAAEVAGDLRETAVVRPHVRVEGAAPNRLMISGRNETANGVPARLTFSLGVHLISDGRADVTDGALRLRNATYATLLIAAATSYVNFADVSADPLAKVQRRLDASANKPFVRLKRDHIRDHARLFDRMTIDLGRTVSTDLPTDERVRRAEAGQDPGLAALYVQYARYLLISSSRPGTQPANLQGIWNDGTNPPWGSKYTININTEMNYWVADPANLGMCVEPLLRMVEELAVSGARTARAMYQARGWVAHHNSDAWRASAPIDGPQWGLWPMGGAWLCTTLWNHWDYSRDDALLRRLYPLMRGAALFFIDTLVSDPGGRGLITSPSLSPENQHPFGAALCAGPAMDRQILRDLFDRTIDAGTRLGHDAELLGKFAKVRAKLASDRVGASGQLQEWLEDWDTQAPEQQHRHVSHLYAVYPSSQINVRDTPNLVRAAAVSLDRRGDRSTGWATAWRLCLWARMGQGERAHAILLGLLGPQRTYPNLFDSHPPFQIDGNFGGAAGILEMLVQSWGDELRLLPALPKAWPSGSIRGVRARGGLVLDMDWRQGRVRRLSVTGPANTPLRIRAGGGLTEAVLDARGRYRLGQ